jgi:hypothetical protein
LIEDLAAERGYNALPQAGSHRIVMPTMVYRNKVQQEFFEGAPKNVACNDTINPLLLGGPRCTQPTSPTGACPWVGTPVTNADGSISPYVSNPDNMGPYWVSGQLCTVEQILTARAETLCRP